MLDTIDIVKKHLMSEEKENKQHCEGMLQLPLLSPTSLNAAIKFNQNSTPLAFGRQRDPQQLPQHAAVLQLPLHRQFGQTSIIAVIVVPRSCCYLIDPAGGHAVGPIEASTVRGIACSKLDI